jgi:hypothetical protein
MNHRATISALCQYMQESTWNHAENLKLGYSHMSTKDTAWVLCKQLARIQRFPRWGNKIYLFRDEKAGCFVHQLKHQDEICRSKTMWKK